MYLHGALIKMSSLDRALASLVLSMLCWNVSGLILCEGWDIQLTEIVTEVKEMMLLMCMAKWKYSGQLKDFSMLS